MPVYVWEKRVCVWCRGEGEGEGDCDVCMYASVCVRMGKGSKGGMGAEGGREGVLGRWRLQGQLRGRPLSGQPQHPSDRCLSVNNSNVVSRSAGLLSVYILFQAAFSYCRTRGQG